MSRTSQESSQNPLSLARPDLLENAIVLADYNPITQDRRTGIPSSTAGDNVASEARAATPQSGTPKRENPFHKPNL